MFPHPHNPAGPLDFRYAVSTYQIMIASGKHTWRNYLLFRYPRSAGSRSLHVAAHAAS